MASFAYVFPGQGSQSVGMMGEWGEHQSVVSEVYAEASERLGYDLWEVTASGPAERLNHLRRMQAIAADLGFSETIFVDWVDPGAPPSVRIFTPANEMPFAGHPLVGCAWTLAKLGPGSGNVIVTPVGPVDFTVDGDAGTVRVEAH